MNQDNISVESPEQKTAKESAAARWRKLIEQQRESGLPVSAYCRERGISAASMFAWKRRLRPAGALPVRQTFKPVTVVSKTLGRSADQPAGAIELRLRDGCHLLVRRGFDRQLLIDLVQALESLA
jgi:hypothetical protein